MKDIRLYINDILADLGDTTGINYNWTETDITNPVVTKVGFSKTITLPGTKTNNKIFNQFWNLERVQSYDGNVFNPSYRVPFILYVNGAVFEKGYVKLQKVKKSGKDVSYEVGLFGGLSNFLYNISTDWNTGEKKTLGSLQYFMYPIEDTGGYEYEDHTPLDLGFTINKSTVNTAWESIWNNGSKWRALNFAPCYNGLNDKMGNDKAVINVKGAPEIISSSTTKDLVTYRAYNGWSLGNLPRECSEWETKDLRCWAQRPVVRTKYILDALCRKENNTGKYDNGYQVMLDEEFFNGSNPYYDDTWLTCPLLTELKYNTEGDSSSAYTTNYSTYYINSTGGSEDNVTFVFTLPSAITQYGCSVTADFDFVVNVTGTTASTLYTGCEVGYSGGFRRFLNGYAIQMFASNVGASDTVLAASETKWLGSDETKIISGYPVKAVWPPSVEEAKKNGYKPIDENQAVTNVTGNFVKYGNYYRFDKQQHLTCDLPVGTKYIKINVQKVSNIKGAGAYLFPQVVMGNNQAFNTPSRYNYSAKNIFSNRDFEIFTPGQNNFFTGRQITQQDILSTDYTPADWLMAYCKMFGLYIHKDPVEDIIYIDTRKTFYNRQKTTDISEWIDYSKSVEITPLVADSKYYAMTTEVVEGGAAKDYYDKYGKTYGMKLLDTGYDFNADTEDIVDIPLRSAIQYRDYGSYFFQPSQNIQPPVLDGTSQTLYKGGNYDSDTYNLPIDRVDIGTTLTPLDSAYTYYDLFDKPQFCDGERKPLDGANVMLFFTSFKETTDMNYLLTDDLDVMARLNNGPCYIITSDLTDSAGNTIAIRRTSLPTFSRYWTPGGQRKVTFSLDFGNPRQFYVPQIYDNIQSTLYYQFYRTYLEDMYDVNTKILTCYVKAPKTLTGEDMRQFYWFDNGIWRLNRIIDINPVSDDSVKVEFIKVQDVENVTSLIPDKNTRGEIIPSYLRVPASGGTYTFSVVTSDGMGFAVEGYSEEGISSITPNQSSADTDIQVVVTRNMGVSGRTLSGSLSWGDTGGFFEIYQDADNYEFSVSASTTNIPASGTSSGTITITNPNGYYWRFMAEPSWMWCDRHDGNVSETFNFRCDPNPTISARTATLEIFETDYSQNYYIEFTQAAGPTTFSVSPSSVTSASGAGSANIYVTTNNDNLTWQVVGYPTWAVPQQFSFTGSSTVILTLPKNTGATRNGSVVLTPSTGSAVTVPISQSGQSQQLINVTFSADNALIHPSAFGWTGWYIDRILVSEHSNWEDAQGDYIFEQLPGTWMEYGDAHYNYMTESYEMGTPSNWRGQSKTFYIFIEAVNEQGTLGQYIRGSVTATINRLSSTTIAMPVAQSGWYGPWSS